MMRKILVVVIVALSACTTAPSQRPAEKPTPKPKAESAQAGINLSGYPREFREGYADGCASAKGSLKKDEARFKADNQYAAGWKDGMGICAKR
ncbi:MAG TPA: hypothetical protein VFH21_06270 [Burkholderiales bacterium]|nr:hypothetical protein [Burkholderiales bacterium]